MLRNLYVAPNCLLYLRFCLLHRSGHWIHQIHSGRQTPYKIREKLQTLTKALHHHTYFEFLSFQSHISFVRFSSAWCRKVTSSSRKKTGTSHLKFALLQNNFQHLQRKFVSHCGHAKSSISVLSSPCLCTKVNHCILPQTLAKCWTSPEETTSLINPCAPK